MIEIEQEPASAADIFGARIEVARQFADALGRYRLETIVPAEYPGRTRHIHVKVQAPRGRVLTTQIYFPGDPGNKRDGLYQAELEMKKRKSEEATFDFVVGA